MVEVRSKRNARELLVPPAGAPTPPVEFGVVLLLAAPPLLFFLFSSGSPPRTPPPPVLNAAGNSGGEERAAFGITAPTPGGGDIRGRVVVCC